MNTILFMTALFLALPQDPVPDLHPDEPVPAQSTYFATASDSEKQIVDICHGAIDQMTRKQAREACPFPCLRPKRVLKRMVNSRGFIDQARAEAAVEIAVGGDDQLTRAGLSTDDPPAVSAIGDGAIIDWLRNGGLEQILAFILAIIEALG